MTALQLNPDIYRQLDIIAKDQSMFDRVTKYINRIVKKMNYDPTCMTKEEFFARIERAEQQYARGEYTTQLPGESVEDMLKRCGYVI